MPNLRIGEAMCVLALALLTPGAGLRAQQAQPFDPRYDLTANGSVDDADASLAASAWADLAGGGLCTPGHAAAIDLNGDGCLDVADVQLLASASGAAPEPAVAAVGDISTWTVDAASLDPDVAPGDGTCAASRGRCTLRAAIQEANRSPGPDLIRFDVRDSNGSCPNLVTFQAEQEGYEALVLDDPRGYGTTIDGYTQCGASPNSGELEGNAVIRIELRGNYRRDIHGLQILSPHNVIRGIAIYNWDRQIEIFGERARYNRVEGNFIGTNAAQTFVSGSKSTHHTEGLRIQIGASYNIVGCGSFAANNTFVPCADPARAFAARNIVAGNGDDGIHLERRVFHNRIVGNYIGLKQDGITPLKNRADGVDFEQGPQYNWLGGLTPLERNVISGNGSEGIEISHGSWTQFNVVAGNYFGLDASGMRAVRNNRNAISFEDAVDQNEAYGNVVAGGNENGFRFYVLATRNVVRDNLIGVAADGRTALPNRKNGVYVMGGSQHNLIAMNVIAYHSDHGVFLASTSDADNDYIGETYYNTISRNRIFSNGGRGISIYGKRGIYPNEALAAPVIDAANDRRVTGRACAGCRVEVFLADKASLAEQGDDHSGEGSVFVGEGWADAAGRFNFATSGVAFGRILTATATDTNGNTSVFARNVVARDVVIDVATPIPSPTPSPTRTPTPTQTPVPAAAPAPQVWLPYVQR